MSDNSPSETSPEISTQTPVEKKKTPLEMVKERQAALGKNRNSNAKSGAGGDKSGGVAEAPTSKPMRSSASKQGG